MSRAPGVSAEHLFLCDRGNATDDRDEDLWPIRRRLDEKGIRYKSLRSGNAGTVFLNISGTALTNLDPLTELPLTHLCLQGCYGIRDFAPLNDMNLVWLNLCRTTIKNLKPLARQPLEHLDLRRTRATDLSPHCRPSP